MGNAKLLPAIGLILVAAVSGCGDGPICQSEILLIIQTPQTVVLGDSNDAIDGVQTDVRVRSTLNEDIDVVLTVLDADDDEVYTDTVATDSEGDVTFEDVDLPDGAATIRVSADAGECGSDEDEVVLDVAAGRGCELTIRGGTIDNDFYDPLGVLNLSNDDDPSMPNFQANIEVATSAGSDVELFITGETGVETSAGTETSDDQGAVTFALSLGQGRQALRAVCTRDGLVTPSLTISAFVDTEAPSCAMTAPAAGATLKTDDDTDVDLTNGLDLTIAAHVDATDVEGEAATFVVMAASTVTVPGSDVDGNGDTTADVKFDVAGLPSNADVQLSTQDHAGNPCALSETYPIAYVCFPDDFGAVGGPCDSNDDCESTTGAGDGVCYFGPLFGATFPPEGFCTLDDGTGAVCANDADCGAGNLCVDSGGYKFCLPACGCTSADCPSNQACFDSFNGFPQDKSACVPGNAAGVDGTACDGFFECNDFSACHDDVEFPGGECAAYGCTLGDDSTCHGGHCVANDAPFSGTTCVDACTSPSDCRTSEGYVCFDPDGAGTAQNYCRHPHIGDACTNAADCGGTGWTCETGGAFPGGYCTVSGCPTSGSITGCTGGSLCYDDPSVAPNYCVDRCPTGAIGTQSVCRAGYLCRSIGAVAGCAP